MDGDGCSSTCTVESSHTCTSPNCGKSTCSPRCGDGTRIGSEACDDGNFASGDGCSSTCTVECGWTCTGGNATTADTCTTTCGDGIVNVQDVEFIAAVSAGAICQAIFWDDCGSPAAGWPALEIGQYTSSQLQDKGFRINGVSGLTLNGHADCQVTLYDGDNFEGDRHTYHKRDFPDGECKWVWSDRAESIVVHVYDDSKCSDEGQDCCAHESWGDPQRLCWILWRNWLLQLAPRSRARGVRRRQQDGW